MLGLTSPRGLGPRIAEAPLAFVIGSGRPLPTIAAMATLEGLKCPNCGADVPVPPPGATSARCAFCGKESVVRAPVAAPEIRVNVQVNRVPMSEMLPEIARAKRSTSLLGAVATFAMVAAVGLVVVLAVRGNTGNQSFQWRNEVVLVSIDGDGVEDFVGAYASRSEKDFPVYVGGFDGATQKRLWQAGPYGTDAGKVHVVAVGTRLVVTDPEPVLHVLAAANGSETGRFALSDSATRVCVPKESAGSVWVETSDQKSVLIDVATATAKGSQIPPSCAAEAVSDCRDVHSVAARCTAVDGAPEIDGFRPKLVLSEGGASISVGTRSPGTATPMAFAFDPETKEVRWKRALVGEPVSAYEPDLNAVDLAGGKLFAEYVAKAKKGGRLMAIDARTGKVVWDIAVPNTDSVATARTMTVSNTRVYLPHWTWLEIFDVQTGAHIATLGAW